MFTQACKAQKSEGVVERRCPKWSIGNKAHNGQSFQRKQFADKSIYAGLPFGMAAARNDIHLEWLAIRNGCGTTPKSPIGPSPPRALGPIRPSTQLALHPNCSGPLAQQFPRALLPKVTREARLTSITFLNTYYATHLSKML